MISKTLQLKQYFMNHDINFNLFLFEEIVVNKQKLDHVYASKSVYLFTKLHDNVVFKNIYK